MKAIIKTSLYLLVTTMILGATMTRGVGTDGQVPFHACFQGSETDTVDFPNLTVDGTATGVAAHLGRFTMHWHDEVNLLTAAGFGFVELVAANGDTLFGDSDGQANPTDDPDILLIVGAVNITGGTGRFEGAAGALTISRLLNSTTGKTSGVIEGTVASPGAARAGQR
jgi:hypothetical protein